MHIYLLVCNFGFRRISPQINFQAQNIFDSQFLMNFYCTEEKESSTHQWLPRYFFLANEHEVWKGGLSFVTVNSFYGSTSSVYNKRLHWWLLSFPSTNFTPIALISWKK